MFPKTENLLFTGVLQLIDEARNAELRRDSDYLHNIFQSLWTDSENLPGFIEYPPDIRAELLRLYGFYLTFYGQAKNLKDYHGKAKDLLTLASRLFNEQQNASKAAETNVLVAFCYWNAGEVANCEAFLNLNELDFSDDLLHPVYLQIKINQLMLYCYLGKFDRSLAIFNELLPSMKFCRDIRLKILFHFESAILLQRKERYHEAVFHFNKSIRLTKEDENLHLLGLTYNNLSLLYLEMGILPDAHLFSNKSLQILEEINDTGWIPHILDSKAMILMAETDYQSALYYVENALYHFHQGEDYKGLIASLWTRVLCLLRLGKTSEAVFASGELQQIAAFRVGEDEAKRYATKFADEIFPIRSLPLDREVLELEKLLISRALLKTHGGKVKAANLLKITHQTLSNALKDRHPQLYEELGFRQRARRGSSKQSAASKKPQIKRIYREAELIRVNLQDKQVSFNFKLKHKSADGYYDESFYYFDESFMNLFGIFTDAIVFLDPHPRLRTGLIVLVDRDNQIIATQTQFDEVFELYVIYDEFGVPIILDKENILGEPIGFCRFDEIGGDTIKFSKLGD